MRSISSRASEREGESARARDREEGAETVSYVLVQILVLIVFFAALQLGFALHTRNLAISAAGEGARRGGLEGGSEAEAIRRADDVFVSLIGDRPRTVSASTSYEGDRAVLTVTVATTLPVLGPIGPRWMRVRGTALVEEGRR